MSSRILLHTDEAFIQAILASSKQWQKRQSRLIANNIPPIDYPVLPTSTAFLHLYPAQQGLISAFLYLIRSDSTALPAKS